MPNIALVGSAGAIAQASAATVSPAFGQATTAGHLLICRVGSNGTAAPTTAASGWVSLFSAGASGNWAAIWGKLVSGAGETAPTFTSTGATFMAADLTEWSNAFTTSQANLVDQSGTVASQAGAACVSPDTAPNDVAIGVSFSTWTKTATYTVTTSWTPAGGSKVADQNTGATKQLFLFVVSAWINTAGGGAADTFNATITPSTGAISSARSSTVSLRALVQQVLDPNVVSVAVPRASIY